MLEEQTSSNLSALCFACVCVRPTVCARQPVSEHSCLPQYELLSRELSDQKQRLCFILVSAPLVREHSFIELTMVSMDTLHVCDGYVRFARDTVGREVCVKGQPRVLPQLSENKSGRQHGFVLELLNSPLYGSCFGLPLSIIPVLNISRHSSGCHDAEVSIPSVIKISALQYAAYTFSVGYHLFRILRLD